MRPFFFTSLSALVVLAPTALFADAVQTIYAQRLVERLLRNNLSLASVTVHAVPPGESVSRVVAATGPGLGQKSADADLLALRKDSPVASSHTGAPQVSLPLRDVTNRTVGVIEFGFGPAGPKTEAEAIEEAMALRNGLRVLIPAQARLFEKFDRGSAAGDTLGQRLVMQAAGSDGDLWVVALHAVPAGEKVNVVIAANVPEQMGHASDEVDTDTAVSGRLVAQMFPLTHRMEVHMPLRRADGTPIATLTTVCLWQTEAEASNFLVRSMRIRDEMEPSVPSFEALFRP